MAVVIVVGDVWRDDSVIMVVVCGSAIAAVGDWGGDQW